MLDLVFRRSRNTYASDTDQWSMRKRPRNHQARSPRRHGQENIHHLLSVQSALRIENHRLRDHLVEIFRYGPLEKKKISFFTCEKLQELASYSLGMTPWIEV